MANDTLVAATYAAILYAAGYLTGLAAFAHTARKRGMATDGIYAVMLAAFFGGLAGAHLAQYLAAVNPGKTILGAVAGGYAAVMYAKWRLGIVRPTGDLFAYALSAGEAVGRLGCFIGGCCYGKVAGVPWAIYEDGAYRHPTQLYLSGAAALTYLVLCRFDRLRPPENSLFFLQGLLMCAFRFAIEYFRAGAPVIGPLTDAQWACALGIVFFAYKFAQRMRPSGEPSFRPAPIAVSS